MASPYNSPNALQNKSGGKGYSNPSPAGAAKFPVKNVSWPSLPKGRGPNRNPWGAAKKAKIHPVSEGL